MVLTVFSPLPVFRHVIRISNHIRIHSFAENVSLKCSKTVLLGACTILDILCILNIRGCATIHLRINC